MKYIYLYRAEELEPEGPVLPCQSNTDLLSNIQQAAYSQLVAKSPDLLAEDRLLLRLRLALQPQLLFQVVYAPVAVV